MLPRRADAVLLLETGVGLRFFFGISAELENEHRYYKMILPSLLVSYYGGAWFGSQLRTSNDHSFIVGVP